MGVDRADATGSLVSSIIPYPVLWMFGRCCARVEPKTGIISRLLELVGMRVSSSP